jgi:hypothetical protein
LAASSSLKVENDSIEEDKTTTTTTEEFFSVCPAGRTTLLWDLLLKDYYSHGHS